MQTNTESSNLDSLSEISFFEPYIKATKLFIADFFVHGFRLVFGFLLCHSIVNFHSFLGWAFPIALCDYVLVLCLRTLFDYLMPWAANSYLTHDILPRLIASGVVCAIFQQSLLLYISSMIIYIAFCYFSRFFSSRILESLTMVFAFSSPWYIFPSLIKVGLSIMYLLDTLMSLNSIQALLRCYFMTNILNDFGIHVPEKKIPDYNLRLPYLNDEDNLQYRMLRNRYMLDKDENNIFDILSDIKQYLEVLYISNPARYETSSGEKIDLPLKWDDLQSILSAYPQESELILKEYYEHQVHTAWRLTQEKNSWIGDRELFDKHQENLSQGIHQELMVMIWLHHKNDNSQEKFVNVLASVGRMHNQGDNNSPDKPADIENFRVRLIQSTKFIHPQEFISNEFLNNAFHSFVFHKWLNQIRRMPKNTAEQVNYVWLRLCEKLQLTEEQLKFIQVFRLDKKDKTDFIIKMHALFGREWLNTSMHAKQIDYCFKFNSARFVCPAEQYTHIFSEVLERFLQEEPSIQVSLGLPRI